MKIRCTDLSEDSGTPWFVCHLTTSAPRKNGSGQYVVEWTAYGTSLFKAKIATILKAIFDKPDS